MRVHWYFPPREESRWPPQVKPQQLLPALIYVAQIIRERRPYSRANYPTIGTIMRIAHENRATFQKTMAS
eukprot:3453067-Pyramimonas_sp.AAC.1